MKVRAFLAASVLLVLPAAVWAEKENQVDVFSVDTNHPNREGKFRVNLNQFADLLAPFLDVVGGLADGDYGDVAVSDGGTVLTVEAGAATTATALAANGANCSAGNYPLGVDASGAVESCTAISGTGDVVGPANSTDNAIARYDSTTGKLLQDSSLRLGDSVAGTGATVTYDSTSGTEAVVFKDDGSSSNFNFTFTPRGASSQFSIAGVDAGNNGTAILLNGVINVVSAGTFNWSSTSNTNNARDTGLAKVSAGVIRATDGSTGIRGFLGGGAAVASATAMPVPTGRVFHVTGTTTITSITSTNFQSGACVTLIFDGILTFTDGSNLKLAGDFVTSADDTISLCYDGSNWYETGRSVN